MSPRTRIPKVRSKPRPGRLRGKKMDALREARFAFDGGICQGCFEEVDPNNWHLAHIKAKRMHGDNLANVRVKHPYCHIVLEHNPKSVPRKERIDGN